MADIPGEESGPVGAAGQGEGGQSGRNGGDGEGHRPDEDEHGHDDDRVRWHVHGTVTEGTGAPVDGAEVSAVLAADPFPQRAGAGQD